MRDKRFSSFVLIVKLPKASIKEELVHMEKMIIGWIHSGRATNWRPGGVAIDKIIPRRTYKTTV